MQKFNMVENALDSLEHAIAHLTINKIITNSDLKRAILDLSHVAELLFKERLRVIHPAFVLANVDKYPSSNAFTVGAEDALKRLVKIGGVEFSEEDQSALKTIREMRNAIEHYEFELSNSEAKIIIGNVLVFIFRFACDELGLDWSERRINDYNWKRLNDYTEFFKAQLAQTLESIDASEIPITSCPICRNDTFDIEAEVCLLCGHKDEVLKCERCGTDYLHSDTEYEEAGLCDKCEWDDGYTSAHHEKY
ncbi:hypothetical protein [Aeromonas allosaccharophila]|uniref:hypothetical protein n=1 Tax=Aeromonas allosaccharophila TaxID=656 RepID=UPI003004498F